MKGGLEHNWRKVTAQILTGDLQGKVEDLILESGKLQARADIGEFNTKKIRYYNLKQCVRDIVEGSLSHDLGLSRQV